MERTVTASDGNGYMVQGLGLNAPGASTTHGKQKHAMLASTYADINSYRWTMQ